MTGPRWIDPVVEPTVLRGTHREVLNGLAREFHAADVRASQILTPDEDERTAYQCAQEDPTNLRCT